MPLKWRRTLINLLLSSRNKEMPKEKRNSVHFFGGGGMCFFVSRKKEMPKEKGDSVNFLGGGGVVLVRVYVN